MLSAASPMARAFCIFCAITSRCSINSRFIKSLFLKIIQFRWWLKLSLQTLRTNTVLLLTLFLILVAFEAKSLLVRFCASIAIKHDCGSHISWRRLLPSYWLWRFFIWRWILIGRNQLTAIKQRLRGSLELLSLQVHLLQRLDPFLTLFVVMIRYYVAP